MDARATISAPKACPNDCTMFPIATSSLRLHLLSKSHAMPLIYCLISRRIQKNLPNEAIIPICLNPLAASSLRHDGQFAAGPENRSGV